MRWMAEGGLLGGRTDSTHKWLRSHRSRSFSSQFQMSGRNWDFVFPPVLSIDGTQNLVCVGQEVYHRATNQENGEKCQNDTGWVCFIKKQEERC